MKKFNKINSGYVDVFQYTFFMENEGQINKTLLKTAIKNFFEVRINNKWDDHHLGILVRIGTKERVIKSLTSLTKINTGEKDKEFLLNYLLHVLEYKENGYEDLIIDKIFFTYLVFKGQIEINYNETKPNLFKKVPHANYSHFKIPVVSPSGIDQIFNYGDVLLLEDLPLLEGQSINKNFVIQAKTNNGIFKVHHYGNEETVLINKVSIFKKSMKILEFIDKINVNESEWTRSINSREYVYNLEGEFLLMTQNKNIFKRINSTKTGGFMPSSERDFVTMDFETFKHTSGDLLSNLVPYLLVFYSINKGENDQSSYYLTDFNSPDEMINRALKDLIKYHKVNALINKKKYDFAYDQYLKEFNEKVAYLKLKDPTINPIPKKYRDDWAHLLVYAHNFSSFDGSFLLRSLLALFSNNRIKILWDKDRRFISIKVSFIINILDEKTGKRTKKTLTITFLDSFRLLPASLLKLTKSFSNNDDSLINSSFDHNKINRSNLLEHKFEAIKYCLQDCMSLHNVINIFNQ